MALGGRYYTPGIVELKDDAKLLVILGHVIHRRLRQPICLGQPTVLPQADDDQVVHIDPGRAAPHVGGPGGVIEGHAGHREGRGKGGWIVKVRSQTVYVGRRDVVQQQRQETGHSLHAGEPAGEIAVVVKAVAWAEWVQLPLATDKELA